MTFLGSRRLLLLYHLVDSDGYMPSYVFVRLLGGGRFCRAQVGLQLISDEAHPVGVKCPQGFLSPAAYESGAGLLGCFGFYFLTSLVLTFV